jgi:hypothetical protein
MMSKSQGKKSTFALATRPAAYVTIKGKFALRHRSELQTFVRQMLPHAGAEPSQHQIIAIQEKPRKLLISTGSVHMAHKIAEALEEKFQGKLRHGFCKADRLLKIRWRRD